jgi:hypothetical protein
MALALGGSTRADRTQSSGRVGDPPPSPCGFRFRLFRKRVALVVAQHESRLRVVSRSPDYGHPDASAWDLDRIPREEVRGMRVLTELLAAVVAAALAVLIVRTAFGDQAGGVKILITLLICSVFLAVFERLKASRNRE